VKQSAVQVTSPRHHSPEPIREPRSVTRSKSAGSCRRTPRLPKPRAMPVRAGARLRADAPPPPFPAAMSPYWYKRTCPAAR